jgi:hypothetical protein
MQPSMYNIHFANQSQFAKKAKKIRKKDKESFQVVRNALFYYADNNLSLEKFSPPQAEIKKLQCKADLFEIKYKKIRLYFQKYRKDRVILIVGIEYIQNDKRMRK